MSTKKIFSWKNPGPITLAVTIVLCIDILGSLLGLTIQLVWGDLARIGVDPASELATPPWILLLYAAYTIVAILDIPVPIFWILRASKNAHVLRGRPLENSPMFAALWWYLIPFAAIFKPVVAMSEIWDVSASSAKGGRHNRFLLPLWWAASIIGSIMGWLALRLVHEGWFSALLLCVAIVQAAAFILIARNIRDMQMEKHLAVMFSDGPEPAVGVLQRLNG